MKKGLILLVVGLLILLVALASFTVSYIRRLDIEVTELSLVSLSSEGAVIDIALRAFPREIVEEEVVVEEEEVVVEEAKEVFYIKTTGTITLEIGPYTVEIPFQRTAETPVPAPEVKLPEISPLPEVELP